MDMLIQPFDLGESILWQNTNNGCEFGCNANCDFCNENCNPDCNPQSSTRIP